MLQQQCLFYGPLGEPSICFNVLLHSWNEAKKKDVMSCTSITPKTANKRNIAFKKKMVMETPEFRITSEMWLKGFDTLMQWFFRCIHICNIYEYRYISKYFMWPVQFKWKGHIMSISIFFKATNDKNRTILDSKQTRRNKISLCRKICGENILWESLLMHFAPANHCT